MVERIIDFSARNRFIVFLLVGVAVVVGVWSSRRVNGWPAADAA